jgi:hypothetical protein
LATVNDRRPKSFGKLGIVRDPISERATVRPPFDPQEFARQSERVTLPPPPKAPSEAPEVVSGTMEVFWPIEASAVPRLAVARDDLEWFELPPLALRLLEHVDGANTVETIAVRTATELTEATDVFDELVREGIVSA